MSQVTRNTETVRAIYKSFAAKDAAAILELLSEDVEWEMGLTTGHGVPWLEPGRGRDHALRFFQTLGQMDFRGFEVLAVMGDGDFVVGVVHVEFVYPKTGKTIRERFESHVWRFDDRGRVTGMRHGADTHAHFLATQES